MCGTKTTFVCLTKEKNMHTSSAGWLPIIIPFLWQTTNYEDVPCVIVVLRRGVCVCV